MKVMWDEPWDPGRETLRDYGICGVREDMTALVRCMRPGGHEGHHFGIEWPIMGGRQWQQPPPPFREVEGDVVSVVCHQCGAVVQDATAHHRWHNREPV